MVEWVESHSGWTQDGVDEGTERSCQASSWGEGYCDRVAHG